MLSPDVNDLNSVALLVDSLTATTLAADPARAIHGLLWRVASKFFEDKDISRNLFFGFDI